MPYDMHRVFFATPIDLDEERQALHEEVSAFNESQAMPRNILFVSVSLPPNMVDKRVYQNVVSQNIRDARYYVQLVEESWGPPERNFERDYAMVLKYAAEKAHACREAVLWFKKPLLPHRVQADIQALKQQAVVEFADLAELKSLLRSKLTVWLEDLAPASTQ